MNQRLNSHIPRARALKIMVLGVGGALLIATIAMLWVLTHWQRDAPPAPALANSSASANNSALPPPTISTDKDVLLVHMQQLYALSALHHALETLQTARQPQWLPAQLKHLFPDNSQETSLLETALQQHITYDTIYNTLDTVALEARTATTPPTAWGRFVADIRAVFTIRRGDAVVLTTEEHIRRARIALEAGAWKQAQAEVAALPDTQSKAAWLAQLAFYMRIQAAYATLENAALSS
jgi:hypothetical protein